jgi:cytoskeletal protein RodZ
MLTDFLKPLVKLMLSFELSAIDIVLLVAVLILLSLYVTKKSGTPTTEPRSQAAKTQKAQEVPEKTSRTQGPTTYTTQPQTGFQNCVHHFGYLKSRPRKKPVPDECFGCPKVLQCLFPNE